MRDMAAHLHARPDLLERTGRGDIHSKSTPAQARRRLATRYRACPSPSWPRAHPARPARAATACAACCAGPQKPAARLFCNHAQPSIPDGKSSMLTASGRSCGARGWPGGSRRAADSTGTAIAFLSGPSCRRVRRPHGRRGKGEGETKRASDLCAGGRGTRILPGIDGEAQMIPQCRAPALDGRGCGEGRDGAVPSLARSNGAANLAAPARRNSAQRRGQAVDAHEAHLPDGGTSTSPQERDNAAPGGIAGQRRGLEDAIRARRPVLGHFIVTGSRME